MSTNTATLNTGLMPGMGTAGAPASGSTSLATTGSGAVQVGGNTAAQAGNALVPFNPAQVMTGVRNVLTQPAVRRALPAIVMLVVLILFGVVYVMMQSTPHRPVMPGLQEADQQLAFDALRGADFKPRIDASTGQLTVPSNRFHEARIFLASQGLPRGGSVGLDALKDQSSMTTSQFMEQVKVNAAMEQELARSVMQIATVLSARVHLATPRQSVFVRERVPPKASVVLAPQPGRMVSPSQVQAIVHLVSSSVPYLAPEFVTVVDNVGNLLTDSAAELKLGLTAAQNQHKQQLEEVYRTRINQILSPMVGEANVRTQVNLLLDFSQSESTTEDFDNKSRGPRTRSEVLAEDRASRREASGVPGALANTAPVDSSTSTSTQADPSKGRSDTEGTLSSRSTRNFELDRTVRYEKKATGNVQRVSVAVVINERPAPPPKEGEPAAATPAPTSIEFTPQELERMQELVRGVVGFDKERGDVVAVVPARFEIPPVLDTIPWYLEDTVHTGIKSGLLALIFVVFMLVVVRPIMRSIAYAQAKADEAAQAKTKVADGELSEEDMRMIQIGEGESLEEIKAKLKPKKSSISIDMLDTANTYDDKVALIRMLVAEDSGRVANVLKGMIRVS
jgi:flagellar M-ring protein FliF